MLYSAIAQRGGNRRRDRTHAPPDTTAAAARIRRHQRPGQIERRDDRDERRDERDAHAQVERLRIGTPARDRAACSPSTSRPI